MAPRQLPNAKDSSKLAGLCAVITAALMVILRPLFRKKAETTFLGGMFGAVLFFFLLIYYGNKKEMKRPGYQLGWIQIGCIELVSLIVSLVIHPVCITTCLLFSIPVVVYLKWAAYEIQQEQKSK